MEIDVEVDEESIAEVSAVIASMSAGNQGHEHSRERDVGAETEVEHDGTSRLPPSLRRRHVPPLPNGNDAVDLNEDVEMEDVSGLPALPEDFDDEMEALVSNSRRVSISNSRRVSMVNAGRNDRSMELLFEPDAEASGSGEADAGASDSSGNGELINGKRKR